jgi:hypothetical protein
MNTDWHELIQRHIAGLTTEEEATLLQNSLKRDDAVAQLYLRYMNLDVALEAHAGSKAAVTEMLVSPSQIESKRRSVWLSWRPLTAAAAGIVFGMLCTSVVFGYVVQRGLERKTPLAVVQPSFEDARMPLAKGFPDASAHWGGDEAKVVMAEHGVSAKEGKFMLRLEASPRGAPRLVYQVIDLTLLPSSGGGEMREIEISASFAAADAESAMRYMIRVFAVSEAREALDSAWVDRRDEAIASATRGLDVMPGSKGWQTMSLKIQVPRAARSLVLFFGVRTPDKTLPKAAHYLDDVQVSLIEPLPLP